MQECVRFCVLSVKTKVTFSCRKDHFGGRQKRAPGIADHASSELQLIFRPDVSIFVELPELANVTAVLLFFLLTPAQGGTTCMSF